MRASTSAVLILALVGSASICPAGELACLLDPPRTTDVVSARRESTVTRLTTVAEPYGVGYAMMGLGGCSVYDAPSTATFGHGLGGAIWAWAVWSLDGIPANAEVLLVEVEHYLWPEEGWDPEVEMRYAQLDSVPIPPPDCEELWGDLQSGSVYTQVLMGQWAGLRHHALGGSAADDVEQLLSDRRLFAIAIQTDYLSEPCGVADFPGWSAGGVDLLVTWRDPSPVEAVSWGRVRSLFRG